MSEFGSNSFIRVPPDSTGKRSGASRHFELTYVSGLNAFTLGSVIEGQSSGATAKVLRKTGTISAGTIHVIVESSSTAVEFTNGEKLLVNSVEYATISAIDTVYVQQTIAVGANNPINGQHVSNRGSAHVRFTEGEQLIDVFGVTKVGNSDLVDQITFSYDANTYRFLDLSGGLASSLEHLSNSKSVALDVGTDIGAYVQRTTHVYYPYHPGYGALVEMTILCGDTKDGVIRRWGRYDNNNGVYFELSGSALSVCLRSDAAGSVTTTKIGQQSWNSDHFDGEGGSENISGLNLDPTKLNLYWIDYAWLGAGSVRFGLYGNDGQRHTLHTLNNQNQYALPYMRQGNLPIRFEVSNSQTTASPSRIAATCFVVKNDGARITPETKFSRQFSYFRSTAASLSNNSWTPVLTWRAATTINSITNRYLSFPGSFAGYCDAPAVFQLVNLAVVGSSSWDNTINSSYDAGLEFDVSGTIFYGGVPVNHFFTQTSQSFDFKLTEHSVLNTAGTTKADGSAGNVWTIVGKSLLAGVSSSVNARLTWTDIE